MKGQFFIFDISLSFIAMLCILVVFFSTFSLIIYHTKENYERFMLQKKLFDASEYLIQAGDNHHVLDFDKFETERLLLEDYEMQITVKTKSGKILFKKGYAEGNGIRRIAICGSEVCTLEIKAEKK